MTADFIVNYLKMENSILKIHNFKSDKLHRTEDQMNFRTPYSGYKEWQWWSSPARILLAFLRVDLWLVDSL